MDQSLRKVFTSHPRQFETFAYAYPVYSRRSQGISLGVNLNPDQLCNFDCPYCQVDRRVPKERREIDPERVVAELRELLARHAQDQLSSVFPGVSPARLVVRDVALSGDGEPTLSSQFAVVAEQLALLQAQWVECGGAPFSLVCITNPPPWRPNATTVGPTVGPAR